MIASIFALHPQAQRQPGEDARRLAADVAGAHQQAVAGDLGVGGVFAEGTEEVVGTGVWAPDDSTERRGCLPPLLSGRAQEWLR